MSSNFFYKGTNIDEMFDGSTGVKDPETQGYNIPEYSKSSNAWEIYKPTEMIIPYYLNNQSILDDGLKVTNVQITSSNNNIPIPEWANGVKIRMVGEKGATGDIGDTGDTGDLGDVIGDTGQVGQVGDTGDNNTYHCEHEYKHKVSTVTCDNTSGAGGDGGDGGAGGDGGDGGDGGVGGDGGDGGAGGDGGVDIFEDVFTFVNDGNMRFEFGINSGSTDLSLINSNNQNNLTVSLPKGATGGKGIKGAKGSKGAKGGKGATGGKGIKGAKGSRCQHAYTKDCFLGVNGVKGSKGAVGSKGNKGNKGAIGNKGTKGTKGTKGEVVLRSLTGEKATGTTQITDIVSYLEDATASVELNFFTTDSSL